MNENHSENINVVEGEIGDILVVTDLVSQTCWERGMVMTVPALRLFADEAARCGFEPNRFVFINPSPPAPADCQDSDSKMGKFLNEHREEFLRVLEGYKDATAIVTLGKWGLRQLYGKPVQITKARGTLTTFPFGDAEKPLLPLLSPREVLRFPDKREIYNTDFLQLQALSETGWSVEEFRSTSFGLGYQWCLDIQHLLDNPPACLSIDCETGSKDDLFNDKFRLLTVALTPKKGTSYVVPLDIAWWNDATLFSHASAAAPRLTARLREKLLRQLRTLLGNPDVSVVGHNLKYDLHSLLNVDVEVANYYADTLQLAFVVDENMQSKKLDDCVRRWLPQFAGYADQFNDDTDKSKMHLVEHEDFLNYAAGDTDTTYRLAGVLLKLAKEDSRQWETFVKVQMPALRAFLHMERQGVRIDTNALGELESVLAAKERELYAEIMREVPPKVLRAHEGNWKLSRADFLIDILFGEDGIRVASNGEIDMENGEPLIPVLFTKSEKKPSTSANDHLPYFDNVPFVQRLMEYSKITKMRSTYVGKDAHLIETKVKRLKAGGLPKPVKDLLDSKGIEIPKTTAPRLRKPLTHLEEFCRSYADSIQPGSGQGKILSELECRIPFQKSGSLRFDPYGNCSKVEEVGPTGFWQYLAGRDADSGVIHPSFLLHGTVTGRTSSRNPNAQNFPKRGALAKAYRKIFVPTPGYTFVESDLSQAELRIAAWMANEPEMLRIYAEGGDIHSATAAHVMGVSETRFNAHLHDVTPLIEVANDWPGSGNFLTTFSPAKRQTVTVADFLGYKRFSAKAVNFGFLYGMGWKKFLVYARTDYGLVYSEEEAQEIRNAFFRKYPRLVRWHEQMREFVAKHGYVRALHGALRRLPNIESDDDGIQGMSYRQAINSPVQRFGSDLGLIALARFVRDCDRDLMRPVLFIHDAVVIEARNDVMEEAAKALRFYMQTPPLAEWFGGLTPPLPIVADVAVGLNLCDMEERPDLSAEAPHWYRSGEEPPTMDPAVAEVWRKKKRRGIILTG